MVLGTRRAQEQVIKCFRLALPLRYIQLSSRRSLDCKRLLTKIYTACRAGNQPYNWTIATYPVSYSYASQSCPNNFGFDAPRTALENSYLTQAIRDAPRDYDGNGVWVDFNSLAYNNCWVTGGPNATCPYKYRLSEANDLKSKIVLVSAPLRLDSKVPHPLPTLRAPPLFLHLTRTFRTLIAQFDFERIHIP
jgi:hypothetical protein